MRAGGALLTQQSSSVSPQQWCFNCGSAPQKLAVMAEARNVCRSKKKKNRNWNIWPVGTSHRAYMCLHVGGVLHMDLVGCGVCVCVAPAGYCIISPLFTSLDYNMDGFDRCRAFHRLWTNSQSLFIMKTPTLPSLMSLFFTPLLSYSSLKQTNCIYLHVLWVSVDCICIRHLGRPEQTGRRVTTASTHGQIRQRSLTFTPDFRPPAYLGQHLWAIVQSVSLPSIFKAKAMIHLSLDWIGITPIIAVTGRNGAILTFRKRPVGH